LGLPSLLPSAHAAAARSKHRTPAKRTLPQKPQKRGAARKTPAKKTKPAAKKPARKTAAKKPVSTAVTVKGHENVFRALDRNDSGFLSRDEWPGSTMAFDAVDKNDDGRISLDELRSRED
jgi:hypothetical protein